MTKSGVSLFALHLVTIHIIDTYGKMYGADKYLLHKQGRLEMN